MENTKAINHKEWAYKIIESISKSFHEYRLNDLNFDSYGKHIVIYDNNPWFYEQHFREYYFPVEDWFKQKYGITDVEFEFSAFGHNFMIKRLDNRVPFDISKITLAPIWHELNKGYYPPESETVWLWADDGLGLSKGDFNYELQKFLYGGEKREFTHWQSIFLPKAPNK